MSPIRTSERQFASGLNVVSSDNRAEALLPAPADVSPADVPTRSQLEQHFRLPDMNDLIIAALQPLITSHDMLKPARFMSALGSTPRELRLVAQNNPKAARPLGIAASLIADELGRRNQVWIFQAALRQI